MRRPHPERLTLLLSAAVLVEAAGIGALFPLLARIQGAYHLPTAGLGLMSAAAFFSSIFGQVALARHLDGPWSRPVLLGGLALGVAAQLWFAAGSDLWQLTAARGLGGISYGVMLPAALKAATEGVAPDLRGARLGRISSMQMVGIVVGPLLGVALYEVAGVRAPFVALGVAGAVITILLARVAPSRVGAALPLGGGGLGDVEDGAPVTGALVDAALPEGLPAAAGALAAATAPPEGPGAGAGAGAARPSALCRPVVAVLLLSAALQLPAGLYDALWSRLLTDRGASTALIGISLTAFGLPYAVLAPLGGRLASRRPLRWSGGAALVATGFMASYGYVGSPVLITVLGTLEACAQAVAGPGGFTAVAAVFPDRWAATGQGWYSASGTLAAGTAALAGAALYPAVGSGVVFASGAAASAGLVAASLLVAHGGEGLGLGPGLVHAGDRS